MGPEERRWRRSPTRREALASLAALVAGSPLLSAAQRDPAQIAGHRRIPGFAEMRDTFDFEPVFRANVAQAVYDYTAHGADSEFTMRRNRDAFDWVDVVAHPAVAAASVDMKTTVLGLSLDFPLFVAPTALQSALHPEGEVGMRGAAITTGTPYIISNNSSQPAEKIASSSSAGPVWFQFYPRRSLDESRAMLERVQNAGCSAVVVTVDQQATTYERTLHLRNLGGSVRGPLPRQGANARNPYRVGDGRLWYEWTYLDRIRPFIKGPMLVKGILTGEDARLCIEHGAQGVIVSNHGGRSLDYGPSTLEVLPEIVDAVGGRVPVLVDSGFRRGSDVMKALALGANAVCLGRATRWGFGAFGPAGAQRVIEMVQAELVAAMAAAGRRSLAELDRSAVVTRFD